MLTFHGLEMRYGAPGAYQLLLDIEKAAGITSWLMAGIDYEERLQRAMRAQDAMNAVSAIAA